MSLGRRLKEVRKDQKLNQTEFSEGLGSTKSAYAKYELDIVIPNEVFINSFCREFGVNKEWLTTGKGKKYIDDRDLTIYIDQLLSGQLEEIKKAGMAMRDLNEAQLRTIIEVIETYKKGNQN